MTIPEADYQTVRDLNVNEHQTHLQYRYWEDEFANNKYLKGHFEVVKGSLGQSVTRSNIVDFYRKPDVPDETKFLAAMIWGHEAPAGSRRDSRGPWKVTKMFAYPLASEAAIRNVSIANRSDITSSYKELDKVLDRCGPNFFTKHFYFLGKSKGLQAYPLIFDDRVAGGLMKVSLASACCSGMVRVTAARKAEAYLQYLDYAVGQAQLIGCDLDQIEYFFFRQR